MLNLSSHGCRYAQEICLDCVGLAGLASAIPCGRRPTLCMCGLPGGVTLVCLRNEKRSREIPAPLAGLLRAHPRRTLMSQSATCGQAPGVCASETTLSCVARSRHAPPSLIQTSVTQHTMSCAPSESVQ